MGNLFEVFEFYFKNNYLLEPIVGTHLVSVNQSSILPLSQVIWVNAYIGPNLGSYIKLILLGHANKKLMA